MNSVASVSYGTAALAFTLLTVLLCVGWRGRRQGAYLITASALTAVWAFLLAAVSRRQVPVLAIYFVEMLRNAGWLLALTFMAEVVAPRLLLVAARASCALVVVSAVALPVLGHFEDASFPLG